MSPRAVPLRPSAAARGLVGGDDAAGALGHTDWLDGSRALATAPDTPRGRSALRAHASRAQLQSYVRYTMGCFPRPKIWLGKTTFSSGRVWLSWPDRARS